MQRRHHRHRRGTTIGGLAYGEQSPESIKSAIDTYLAPLLKMRDATRVGQTMAKTCASRQGNSFAKSAVEIALLDAQGKRLGLPVSAARRRHRNALPVAWTLASGDADKDIDEAERVLEARRHNIFKLKIGKRAVADDIAHVAAIKRALGDEAAAGRRQPGLGRDRRVARQWRCSKRPASDLVEQPIARRTGAGLARLAARFDVAIMADEAVHEPDDAFDLAAKPRPMSTR